MSLGATPETSTHRRARTGDVQKLPRPQESRTAFAVHSVTEASKIHPLTVLSPAVSFSSLVFLSAQCVL